jgi:4-hydroxy-2-oxoheptanedioate aldolase
VPGYAKCAAEEICLLVQVETRKSLDAIEDIAAVDGVDGIFIGPGDLSASLGHPGELFHPEVVAAVEGAISRVAAAGKPAGVLTYDLDFARRCMELGTLFTAVGADLAILVRGVDRLASEFKSG